MVRKLYEHDRAYIFQNADGRIIFVIPYQNDFTLIGTTDRDYDGDPAKVKASPEEIQYLCASASEYLKKPVLPADVVWTYSGVRRSMTTAPAKPRLRPAITCSNSIRLAARRCCRSMAARSRPIGGSRKKRWNGSRRICAVQKRRRLDRQVAAARRRHGRFGGRRADGGTDAGISVPHPGACQPARACLWHACDKIARQREIFADLGQSFGATLTESEVRYLMSNEWAYTADDVVWRRSKLGLRLSPDEIAALDEWIKAHRVPGERPLREAGGRP